MRTESEPIPAYIEPTAADTATPCVPSLTLFTPLSIVVAALFTRRVLKLLRAISACALSISAWIFARVMGQTLVGCM